MSTIDTHLCARMSDEQAAAIPAQAAPVANPTIDTTGAATIVPFREAFEIARQAFEAARPTLPAAPAARAVNRLTRPARAVASTASAGDQLVSPDSVVPLINHSDVDMDDVVLHEEPEQIDQHLSQPTELSNNHAPAVEPTLNALNEQDQQEENDSLQVDTAIQAATDAALSSALAQPTQADGPLPYVGEQDNMGNW